MDVQLNLSSDSVQTAQADAPLIVAPELPVRDVFRLLQLHGAGSVLVCRGEKLVGIFTERDALKMMAADADLDVAIEAVMVPSPVTVPQQATVGEAIKIMSDGGYRRLPIVDEAGDLQGVVKVSGIVHYLVDHFPTTVFNLPPDPNVIMPEREGA